MWIVQQIIELWLGVYSGSYELLQLIIEKLAHFDDANVLHVGLLINWTAPIAGVIIFAMFVLDLVQQYTMGGNQGLTLEMVMRSLLRYGACYALVYFIQNKEMIKGFFDLWNASQQSAKNLVTGMQLTDLFSDLRKLTIANVQGLQFRLILQVSVGMLSVVGQLLAAMGVAMEVITMKIEFLVRLGGLPLAVPTVMSEGMRSTGIRYIKKTVAAALGIGVAYIVCFFVSQVCTGINAIMDGNASIFNLGGAASNVGAMLFTALFSLIGPFMVKGAISTSKTLIREALE